MALTAITIPSPEREQWLDRHLPYRIQILRGLALYDAHGGPNGPWMPVFPGIFEASLVACRWSASFLGLCLAKSGSLQQVTKRPKVTDVFSVDVGGALVDPTVLPAAESTLLALVFKGANVASAHPVREGAHAMTPAEVPKASVLLIRLIETHVYDRLGLAYPEWKG